MNNKGFTLIELVATIALLAVISVISFVSINTVVKKNKVSNCENLVKNINIATKEYVSDYRYDSSFDDNGDKIEYIFASTLINKKYLVGPIMNPFDTDTSISGDDISIKIELNNDYSTKKVTVYNVSGNEVICENNYW